MRKDSNLENGLAFKAVKMAKRGNDVYARRIKERLRGLDQVPNINWFNPRDRNNRPSSGALFVTLTYRRYHGLDVAWELVGEDFNRFISALRARYGVIHVFRTWEAQRDGYPHVHAILYFESQAFQAFHYGDAWRIQDKRELEDLWPHGFIDVEALASLRGGIRYVAKYLAKVHQVIEGPEIACNSPEASGLSGLVSRASVLTMALAWAMGRRAFSVFRGFFDLTTDLHNSNSGQADLFGDPVYRWILVGFWSGDLGKWVKDLSFGELQELRGSPGWSDNRPVLRSSRGRVRGPSGIGPRVVERYNLDC